MKKLLKVLAVGIFTLTPFIIGGSTASAQSTCSIGYTGPDSNNMCTSVTQYSCSVNNTNMVEITNENSQIVASGTVSNSGNTQGGSSVSGTVTNTNGSTFVVTIVNQNPDSEEPGVCSATAVIPANVVPETPVQPTKTASEVAVLPKTSGDVANVLVVIVGSLTVLAVMGVGGVALYRYYKSL